MNPKELSQSVKTCKKNGNRLLEDAGYLFDFDRFATAYGLAKLAQEEFAKGFILRLVESGALKWTKEVRKSLNHHVSKQLMTVILEFLNPDTDDFLRMVENKTLLDRPPKVSDAINIYIHEVLNRWESANWVWAEDPEYDKEAKSIFNGKVDRTKQNSFYVKISVDGSAVDFTGNFNRGIVELEIEKAKRYGSFLGNEGNDFRFKEIIELIRLIKK